MYFGLGKCNIFYISAFSSGIYNQVVLYLLNVGTQKRLKGTFFTTRRVLSPLYASSYVPSSQPLK